MAETRIGREVEAVLGTDPTAFQSHVEADAETVKSEIAAGTFDNPTAKIGLEYEFYAVVADRRDSDTDRRDSGTNGTDSGVTNRRDSDTDGTDSDSSQADTDDGTETAGVGHGTRPDGRVCGTLERVPRRVLSAPGFEKELGLHNAELCTTPQPATEAGIAAQRAEIEARLQSVGPVLRANGCRLVSDGIWTIPPRGRSATAYLTESVTDDGLTVAVEMSDAARYHAMGNTDTPMGCRVDTPHATLDADSVMPESLISSIQPHYQLPQAATLPTYFRYALRIAGPLLALAVNSPFLPPSLYNSEASSGDVLRDEWHETRVSVFESSCNAPGVEKVRFPDDVATVEAAVDAVVADETVVPMEVERGSRFDDAFAAFRQKHGTFWRWVRPVFDGRTREAANVRIEFRPLPGQPTLRDTIALQAAFTGALEGLRATRHPVRELDWTTARENFYAAARDGIDADLRWITRDGDETTDGATIYDELLAAAERGLATHTDTERAEALLAPLADRVRRGLTPAGWKHALVAERLAHGDDLHAAIHATQRAYVDRQAETFFEGSFADWSTPPTFGP